MAGAPMGGAELFFERLCAAQVAAGDTVLAAIKREPARAARLRAAGLDPLELGFGQAWICGRGRGCGRRCAGSRHASW